MVHDQYIEKSDFEEMTFMFELYKNEYLSGASVLK